MRAQAPKRLFWVVLVKGAFVSIEGLRLVQFSRGPSTFASEDAAREAIRRALPWELLSARIRRV